MENDLDAGRFLVEAGADVNTRNDFGDTPLMDAASLNYTELCRYLLATGADDTFANHVGKTALMGAATSSTAKAGDIETFRLLLEHVIERGLTTGFTLPDEEDTQ